MGANAGFVPRKEGIIMIDTPWCPSDVLASWGRMAMTISMKMVPAFPVPNQE